MDSKIIIKSPEDLTILINSTSCVIIKLSAIWCGSCNQIKKSYENLKSKYFSDNIKFIELDVNKDRSIVYNKKYYDIKFQYIPYFLIATNGAFTHEFTGSESINKIDLLLTKLFSEAK